MRDRLFLPISLAAIAILAPPPPAPAEEAVTGQAARILVDGEVDDWRDLKLAHRDPPSDGPTDGLDLGGLWIANDEHYLFLRLEVGREILLQSDNNLTLYIDSDDDATTGQPVHGIGAELRWTFGRRRGEFVRRQVSLPHVSLPLGHQHIGLISAPTVSADEFEIVLSRRAMPHPEVELFTHDTIRIAIADQRQGGDLLPDEPGGVVYRFDESPLPTAPVIALDKHDPAHLRVMSYNLNDHLGDSARQGSFRRIFGALRPDVIVLQEIRSLATNKAAALLENMLPPPAGGRLPHRSRWHAAKEGGESNLLMSPFPIASVHRLGDSAAFLLDLGSAERRQQLLLIVASTPCCNRNRERQYEIDHIMAFVRDAKSKGGEIDLAADTPIAIVGDANLVGDARQRRTLLTGDILNRGKFGPPFAPDWDGTPFTDLVPRHTHRPLTFTWYGRDFSPGRLDYVVYSDAVLGVGNHFVLFTPDMPAKTLARHGLERQDVLTATDHLPLVVDFVLPRSK